MSLAYTEKESDIEVLGARNVSLSEMEKVLTTFLKKENNFESLSGNEQVIYQKLLEGIKQTGTGTMKQ